MSTKTISGYAFALLAVLAMGSNAEARRGGPEGKSVIHKKMMKELDLTAEQKIKIKAIKDEERKDTEARREQRKGLEESMSQAIIGLNESEMRKAHDQLEQMRTAHSNKRFESLVKLLKILTPEQRKEFAQLHKKHKDHRKGRRGRGMRKGSDE